MMALRHIGLTRKSAVVIASSLKYFQAKKRYYLLQKELDPEMFKKSNFIKLLKKAAKTNKALRE